ncbi:hypothetical protein TcasGA2_TC031890 [Tribolium castaneum]|uniref:Uncharacterized protein n=1 Tax=Tribolium castaneum TaxID=7070 RepID=A0A139W9G8_TRICA|nr:PREDICTED: uncharacterized protein LOC100142351 isoform X1 [Tribolium castaneum]XP_008201348.1 PREDICTED: uncharacterized protein LOC100142351 isoform X1 [Tribolium castaneum]XP_008201357.1 PREDICTED: uncharacterized protein LOC100142351 isoform X1 [Tribolium castaneum]XP_008201363.1 PREDICTED: uncharacterized protein LOC100142351 isoform X1 [Tribolium castaneum]XP_008201366.1 PREDICTED: uncharacterized protein LOC100142351 isoform X1 [Tribolium castaneum]KYB24571.1 hypothetical protein Tca|eukprot:XP_001808944.1 PREDICTED: uncharacterized protein LOC100142351 isoform X1 [Tribolium castaneum]
MPTRFEDILKDLKLDSKDRQILELCHKHELELELLKKGNELELLKKGNELELLKKDHEHQLDKLKTELSAANWENLKHLKLVQVRSFIDSFDNVKKLDQNISRKVRFTKFAKENEDRLKSWNLSTESFCQIFQHLYVKLCDSAHPVFTTEDTLEIGGSHLEDKEIRIIGFLWEMYPLPPEKLLIRIMDKSESVEVMKIKTEL